MMASIKDCTLATDGDLTASELALVSANEKAGLVSQLACHFCGMQFDVKKTRSLRSHIEEVHVLGDTGYMCGICCEEFISRKAVENHMSTFHRAPKPLGCGTCGETFRVRNLLLKHIDSHTKDELDKNKVGLCYCGECFEFFDSVVALQAHSTTHKEQAVYVCGTCGLQSQHRQVMVKHLETHVIANILDSKENQESKQVYEMKPVLVNASRIQILKEPNSADDGEMNEEMVTQRNEQDTSYKCGMCQASFTNLADALAHADTHQGPETQFVQTLVQEELNALLPDSGVTESEVPQPSTNGT